MALWKPGDPLGSAMSPSGRLIMPSFGAVALYTLFTNMPAPCRDTTGIYTELDADEILRIGPHISGITCFTNTVGRTSAHSWGVSIQWTNDFKNFYPATPAQLFTAIIANGPSITTEYTTVANFGLGLRFAMWAGDTSGSTTENATVSCTLALRLKT